MAAERRAIVEILRLDVEGDGVAEIDARLVRVPYVLPGERVEVTCRPGRDDCEVVRLITPSPHRITPRCRHFGPCGGCAWQHVAYGEQLRLKQELLQRLLDHSLGPRAPRVLPTAGTPFDTASSGPEAPAPPVAGAKAPASPAPDSAPWHYRNKVAFVFGPGTRGRSLEMGHYRRRSRSVIPVVECPVHSEAGNRAAFAMRDTLLRAHIPGTGGDASDGVARHIVLRASEAGDDWLATLVVTENVKPLRRVTEQFVRANFGEAGEARGGRRGLYLNVNHHPGPYLFGRETRHLAGARDISEEVAGVSYLLSPTSFFQTNVRAARVLVAGVLDALADRRYRRVLDLYAGSGLFALPLARDGRLVTAVEENREAMEAAVTAARRNRVSAAGFRAIPARVEEAIARLTPRSTRDAWDAVVLDPPRQGCPPAVLDWLFGTLRPRRMVYVSCNPEALAEDLRYAPASGYGISRVQPVDMFPHTAHIESIAVMDLTAGS